MEKKKEGSAHIVTRQSRTAALRAKKKTKKKKKETTQSKAKTATK